MRRARAGLPVVRDQPGLAQLLDVGLERERGDVGLEALDDRARLRAAALVRLLEVTVSPVLSSTAS